MPSFRYKALTSAGQHVGGVVAAANEQAVLAELEHRSLVPVEVREEAERRRLLGGGVSVRRLATAYQQIADLLRAGVPLLRSLRLVGKNKSAPVLAKVFEGLADAVSEGSELAEAMGERPDIFPRIHIAMVRAGEKGGFLEQVLARLAQFLHAQADLRAKVIGNLIYPTVLVVVGVAVLLLVFGVLVPRFRPMLEAVELNALSAVVFALSDFVRAYWAALVVAVAGVVVGLWWASKSDRLRQRIAEWQLRLPVIGPLLRSLAVARFCRILGTMLGNAIPMISAMQIAREAAGNAVMEAAVEEATEAVRQGESLAPPLAKSGLFPEDVIEMISVGEAANNLDTVLVTIAETVESRIDRMLTVAVRLIEPVLLVTLAVVIGVVAIALILPMTQLGQAV